MEQTKDIAATSSRMVLNESGMGILIPERTFRSPKRMNIKLQFVTLESSAFRRRLSLAICAAVVGFPHFAAFAQGDTQLMPGAAEQLMALANRSRAQAGNGPLKWDSSLAAAASQHCLRMAAEGPISHRYAGEADLSTRAGQAGAHFDVIEENVAIGPNPIGIHDEWMHSPGHRANLLSPEVNLVGIAVVSARGVLYATADYARSVEALSPTQVEARVASLIRVSGLSISKNDSLARAACVTDHGIPESRGGPPPSFVMRWQDSELDRLPEPLTQKLETGRFRQAAVGSCPAQGVDGRFTAYRVAVLLY